MASYIERSKEELEEMLKEQIQFLKASSQSYQAGFLGEARRLALTVRILIHDTKRSASLLTQLGIKETIGFIDTCEDVDPANLFPTCNLVGMRVGLDNRQASQQYFPVLHNSNLGLDHTKPFQEWWDKIVVKDDQGREFSRKDLILTIADQDGGAHIDPKLDEEFVKFSRGISLAMRSPIVELPGQLGRPVKAADLACVCQIAFEVEKSIEQSLPPNNRSTNRNTSVEITAEEYESLLKEATTGWIMDIPHNPNDVAVLQIKMPKIE